MVDKNYFGAWNSQQKSLKTKFFDVFWFKNIIMSF